MKRLIPIIASVLLCLMTYAAAPSGPEKVIPAPYETIICDGCFILPENGVTYSISAIPGNTPIGKLTGYLESIRPELEETGREEAVIRISVGNRKIRGFDPGEEGYVMEISGSGIDISSKTEAGALYAMQTLLQMTGDRQDRELVCCTIKDRPRFGYRGLMVDVSRHFRSREFLMKQMDAMLLLKMNMMHLHLTDAAGWRIGVEGYPELTELAAWRPYRRWKDWNDNGCGYCRMDFPGAYGGYYTKDDIRELVEYASERNITIIPEIEMPGHSDEVLAAYPELSCGGDGHAKGDLCPGKEATFRFLEDVLSEIMEMFPGEYIHIGGDEASKVSWKECPDCRRRMEEEGISDVDGLQSYMIHRIGKFIRGKGRKMIGWDEIIQGGLAPDAVVMSWRGTEGGIAAIRNGNDAIMTPGEFCYLDYTQDARFKEPESIGGYTPLKKTYSYDPGEGMPEGKGMGRLLGIQGNLWSEWVTEDSHAEYMYYPRAYAIAEAGWSGRKSAMGYEGFRERALVMNRMLQSRGYTTFDLENEYGERKESLTPVAHKAVGKKVTYRLPYRKQYAAGGDTTLTDGLLGGWTYGDRKWQGFMTDFDATVDLGEEMRISYVGITFMQTMQAWVYMPGKVAISVSGDGSRFTEIGTVYNDISAGSTELLFKPFYTVCDIRARYVRIEAENSGKEKGFWLFADEIIVN